MTRRPHLEPGAEPTGTRLGQWALAAGVAAVFSAVIPGVGELVTLPASGVALALGLLGVRWYETGRSARVVPSAAGAGLGALAAFGVLVVTLASRT